MVLVLEKSLGLTKWKLIEVCIPQNQLTVDTVWRYSVAHCIWCLQFLISLRSESDSLMVEIES